MVAHLVVGKTRRDPGHLAPRPGSSQKSIKSDSGYKKELGCVWSSAFPVFDAPVTQQRSGPLQPRPAAPPPLMDAGAPLDARGTCAGRSRFSSLSSLLWLECKDAECPARSSRLGDDVLRVHCALSFRPPSLRGQVSTVECDRRVEKIIYAVTL